LEQILQSTNPTRSLATSQRASPILPQGSFDVMLLALGSGTAPAAFQFQSA
jgi:hypothetical protein